MGGAPPPPHAIVPDLALTPRYGLRFAAAITAFGAGMHYLSSGRSRADFGRMIVGAALTIASLFFLW